MTRVLHTGNRVHLLKVDVDLIRAKYGSQAR